MKRVVTWIVVWSAAIGVTILLMSTILPWAGTRGYAGSVIEQNYRDKTDATALFWTESERTLEIVAEVERNRSNNAD